MCLFDQEIVMSIKNVLNAPQVYKLTNWLDQNPILVRTLFQSEVAEKASIELGFHITTPNIVMDGKNLGIKVGKQNYTVRTNITSTQIMASAICDLYTKFGELMPEDLMRLAK